MYINHCGIGTTHSGDFSIDRPHGSGDYLFIFTKTPFIMVTNNKINRCPEHTTVFFKKGDAQHFMAAGSLYQNDYIHFQAQSEDEAFINSLPLRSGKPFINIDSSAYINIHRLICMEYICDNDFRDTAIDSLLRYFLIKLSHSMCAAALPPVAASLSEEMEALRAEIYKDVHKNRTIAQMSKQLNISPSYFQASYKKMFKRSCISDVIYAKIEHAKLLLTSTAYPIGRVAQLCGYENETHFARQFKRISGMTASEYRKNFMRL
ncbi:MAG: helix-turn-helix transcriptional regulator [Clostridia bacterium]|nr:helix-turn-helix transcriptional regulator [Clostridia bacterium]